MALGEMSMVIFVRNGGDVKCSTGWCPEFAFTVTDVSSEDKADVSSRNKFGDAFEGTLDSLECPRNLVTSLSEFSNTTGLWLRKAIYKSWLGS